MMKKRSLLKMGVIVGLSIAVAILSALLTQTKSLDNLEFKFSNAFFTRNEPSKDIVIVGVDAKSINSLQNLQNSPRPYYTQAIENIAKDKPTAIGMDIIFKGPSTSVTTETIGSIVTNSDASPDAQINAVTEYTGSPHPYDAQLANAFKNAGNIVLIKKNTDPQTDLTVNSVTESLSLIDDAAKAWGFNYTVADSDGIIRRVPIGFTFEKTFTNSFAITLAKIALSLENTKETVTPETQTYTIQNNATTLNIPVQNNYTLINYATLPYAEGYPVVPFVDVYNNTVPAGTFTNKIVLVGWVSEVLKDQFPTPHIGATGRMMPGVEIHANAIQMLLEGNFLEQESPFMVGVIMFFFALFITACIGYLRIRWTPLYLAFFFIAYWFLAQYAFNHGLPLISGTSIVNDETVRHKMLFAIATPYLCMAIAYVATLAWRYTTEVRSRLALKNAFSHYLAPTVVEKIADMPEQVKLGGERRDMTFLFSDIHDFTPFSESRDPAEVAKTLNEYFTAMAECVFAEGGTLDKFEGDALMAFWGAPLDQPDHASRAIRAALRMRIALKKLHAKWATENRPLLFCRIGINSGEAIVGNMGSDRRFDYTAIGDNVNLASRLEQANKQFDSTLLISEETMARIRADTQSQKLAALPWKKLGEITVKGKSKVITVWTLEPSAT